MDLKNLRVMIDTYNIRLIEGSGIASYGLTLIKALEALGADVSALFDKRASRIPELRAVLFFDAKEKTSRRLSGHLGLAVKALRLLTWDSRPQEIEVNAFNSVIIDARYGGMPPAKKVYNLPECYELANTLFRVARLVTRIKLPGLVDIWHATYPLPITMSKAKKVTTIHDLIPLKLPYTTLDNKEFFYRVLKDAVKKSDLIVTVSENTKRDIIEFFHPDEDKIAVTYQPIVQECLNHSESHANMTLQKYQLKSKDYILFVGNVEPKKNVARIIEAFASIQTDISLVIVGRKAWMWKNQVGRAEALLGKTRYRRQLRLLDYVPRADIGILYANALFFVFPSLYEGFGLPPLEAMYFDCPVITSNTSSLPEVCGDAALYVDPYDVSDIRAKMESLLSDESLRKDMAERGRKRVRFFSMENYQRRLYEAYLRVI